MSRTNVFLLIIAAIAIAAAVWYRQQVFQQPAVRTRPSLAFVTGGSGPYWQITARGARAAAEKFGIDLRIEMPGDDESLPEQMTLLTRLDCTKLDGLALSPLDADGQTPLINRMQTQTNVVTFDSDAPLSLRRGHVGTSNYGAGTLCARLVAEALPEGGKVLVLLANLTKENLIDRKSGFEDYVNKPPATSEEGEPAAKLEVVGFLTDDGDDQATERNLRDSLEKHPDLTCIVGMNAQHGPLILKFLESVGKLGEIKVVAFDEEAPTLTGIEEGHIYATIAQDPYKYGYEATRMLYQLHRDGASEVPIVGGGTININAEAIRQKDLAAFKQRLEARLQETSAESTN
jgi:ribose transport system substrate-binding protein